MEEIKKKTVQTADTKSEIERTRYSDEELAEFKGIIIEMLDKAKKEYDTLRKVVMHNGTNDIEDTIPSFKTVEDDGAMQLSLKLLWAVSKTRLMVYVVLRANLYLRRGFALCLMQHLRSRLRKCWLKEERISLI